MGRPLKAESPPRFNFGSAWSFFSSVGFFKLSEPNKLDDDPPDGLLAFPNDVKSNLLPPSVALLAAPAPKPPNALDAYPPVALVVLVFAVPNNPVPAVLVVVVAGAPNKPPPVAGAPPNGLVFG